MKPTAGMRTSEFILALGAFACNCVLAYNEIDGSVIASVNAPVLAYIGNRAYVKRGRTEYDRPDQSRDFEYERNFADK